MSERVICGFDVRMLLGNGPCVRSGGARAMSKSDMQGLDVPARHATTVTLPEEFLRRARELKITVSQARERGPAAQITQSRAERWLIESRAAMDAWNDYVDRLNRPLARFRQFWRPALTSI